ncbi:hypothetical protein D3C76_1426630 [compost metagenome]
MILCIGIIADAISLSKKLLDSHMHIADAVRLAAGILIGQQQIQPPGISTDPIVKYGHAENILCSCDPYANGTFAAALLNSVNNRILNQRLDA